MWIEGGLIYVDFMVQDGSVIAFRPSVWMATSATGQQITRDWQAMQRKPLRYDRGEH